MRENGEGKIFSPPGDMLQQLHEIAANEGVTAGKGDVASGAFSMQFGRQVPEQTCELLQSQQTLLPRHLWLVVIGLVAVCAMKVAALRYMPLQQKVMWPHIANTIHGTNRWSFADESFASNLFILPDAAPYTCYEIITAYVDCDNA